MNVSLPAPQIGFAVANDAEEHERLTAAGYVPALEKSADLDSTEMDKAAVMAALDNAGITYNKRLGLEKLKALLPA